MDVACVGSGSCRWKLLASGCFSTAGWTAPSRQGVVSSLAGKVVPTQNLSLGGWGEGCQGNLSRREGLLGISVPVYLGSRTYKVGRIWRLQSTSGQEPSMRRHCLWSGCSTHVLESTTGLLICARQSAWLCLLDPRPPGLALLG